MSSNTTVVIGEHLLLENRTTGNMKRHSVTNLLLILIHILAFWLIVVTVSLRGSPFGSASISPPQKWLCMSNLCLTYDEANKTRTYQLDELFESQNDCRLSCGPHGAIWPMPTGLVYLSHKRVLLDVSKIRLNVLSAQGEDVYHFLFSVKRIFLDNLLKECVATICQFSPSSPNVYMKIEVNSSDMSLNGETNEAYTLAVRTLDTGTYIDVFSQTVYGARHALETLTNLVTGALNGSLLMVANAKIQDEPVFQHRGVLIDSARNFIPMNVIYRSLDAMAASKLNVFHWHVVDTHSFPLEIKRVPNLQRFGAYSSEETYSQVDVSNMVKYAQLRGIRVIFEIDGPSHAGNGWQWGPLLGLGNLSVCVNMLPWRSYCTQPPCGQLNPFNANMYVIMKKIYEDILEMGAKEETIHMGGDEVNLNCWNSTEEIRQGMIKNGISLNEAGFYVLWSQFHQNNWDSWNLINRKMYPKYTKEKKVILWSSALTDPGFIKNVLPANKFIIQTWVPSDNNLNVKLLKLGYDVLISTKNAWYLDHGFWGNTLYYRWETVYGNRLPNHTNVLGGEVCMWSEHVDRYSIESRIWPRAGAAAERLWSDPNSNALESTNRFIRYRNRLIARGIAPEAILPRWCEIHEGSC